MGPSSQKKVLAYLGVPFFVLFVFTIVLLTTMAHYEQDIFYAALILGVFAVTVALEIYLFKMKIAPQLSENDKIKKLLEDQERSGKLLIRRDLELTKANDKLQELDERKSEFVSIVAHQLRTPLSGVKWTLDLLINGEFGELNVDQKAFLMKSYESNQRLIALINDMLNVDRIESGKHQYVFRDAHILDLFDTMLFEMKSSVVHKQITVEFVNRSAEPIHVSVDVEKMRAVIQNLLDNAIKYTPQGGKIYQCRPRRGIRQDLHQRYWHRNSAGPAEIYFQ